MVDQAEDPVPPQGTGNEHPWHATLMQWRAQGADQRHPLRFAQIEALARRAMGYEGLARAALDARMAQWLASYAALLLSPVVHAGGTSALAPTTRGVLGQLVDEVMERHSKGARADLPMRAPPTAAAPVASARGTGKAKRPVIEPPAPGTDVLAAFLQGELGLEAVHLHSATPSVAAQELTSVRRFRGTWSRLSADERLRQTLAQVPPQAGPLNALNVLHRALVQMRELSPQYLQHFVAHVDALLWLEQVQAASAAAGPTRLMGSSVARRKAAPKKT